MSALAAAGVIIGIVTGLIAVVGVLAVAFKTGHSAQVIANSEAVAQSWRERAEAMEEKAKARDEAIKELQDHLAQKDKEISVLQGRIATLSDVVTSKTAIETLAASFEQLGAHMNERVAEALTQAGIIRGEIRDVHESVETIAAALAKGEPSGTTRGRATSQARPRSSRTRPEKGSGAVPSS